MTRLDVLRRIAARDPRYRAYLPDPPLPGLLTQALNLAGSVAAHVAGGCQEAPQAEQERRIALCRACDRHRGDGRCAECGCWTRTKAAWLGEKCPLGKW